MSHKQMRVRSKTTVAGLGQSIAQALQEHPIVELSAVGISACHKAQRGIGASDALLPSPPWVQIQLQTMEFQGANGESQEREGTNFVVARDLEAAAEWEKRREE